MKQLNQKHINSFKKFLLRFAMINSWHFDFIFLIIKDSPRTGGIIIACSLPQNWRIPPDLGKFCIVKISFLKFSKIFSFILQKINLVPHSSIIKECSWVIMGLQHYFGMRKCTSKKRHFPRSGGFPQNQNFSFPQIWGNFPRSGCSLTVEHHLVLIYQCFIFQRCLNVM